MAEPDKAPEALPHPGQRPAGHKRGGDSGFGQEGTNKTLLTPQANPDPEGELQGTRVKYIPDTPYNRG